jgi:hypothetical protein
MQHFLCKPCGLVVPVPDFTPDEIQHIIKRNVTNMKLHFVHWMITEKKIDHADAKTIALHLVNIPNQCNRCKTEFEQQEYCNCPKCGAFHICW